MPCSWKEPSDRATKLRCWIDVMSALRQLDGCGPFNFDLRLGEESSRYGNSSLCACTNSTGTEHCSSSFAA